MRIFAMKTNHIRSPLGFALSPVTFSWKVDQSMSGASESSRIEVADDEHFAHMLHDSGFVSGISGIAYTPAKLKLKPRTRYWWRVSVRGDMGDEAVSDAAWFETGKIGEAWSASWIVPPFEKHIHPLFRKSFVLAGEIISARVYACGLGVYELSVNGLKAGAEHLAPGLHSCSDWLQVQTYDVTGLLKPGENVIGAMLGNGWAKGRFGPSDMAEIFCGEFGFIAELHLAYKNGDTKIVTTGEDWFCSPSPVLGSSIYDGEVYDATMEQPGWDEAGFEAPSAAGSGSGVGSPRWEKAVVSRDFQSRWGLGPLRDRLSLPVKAMEELAPVALIRTPAGEDVLDMGQNMAGHVRFRCRAPKGAKLSLYFGEILQDGNFYRDNLRGAKAEYHYISSGRQTDVRPLFTFYGFRYVKLEGFESIDINDFKGVALYSEMELTGNIETSDDNVNRLFKNVLWGQKGNFLDVPTDCPQRDERLGWTGDAQIFCETAAWNMDVYAFFTKYLRDMSYGQSALGGAVPHVVPDIYPRRSGKSMGWAACGWADAATVIPWTLYEMYGDKNILRVFFPVMRDWVDWIRAEDERSGGRRLWTTGFHFGDWLAMDAPVPGGAFGATDVDFLASAYYFASATHTANAAEALGDAASANRYNMLAAEVRSAIRREFFTRSGRIAVKTQTAMAIALHFYLYPEGARERLVESLKLQLVSDGMKLKTGFLGTPVICDALTAYDAHSYALRLFMNEEMPGWLYPVKMGATTIWERWDSVLPDGRVSDTGMNSLNHYSFGCIAGWMYRNLCGIVPAAPGFERVRLAPRPCRQLDYARASFDSPFGMVTCGWRRLEGGKIEVECDIPFGVKARLDLPGADLDEIRGVFAGAEESGKAIVVYLKAGSYRVAYTPAKAKKFSLSTPVYELLAHDRAGALFASIPAFKSLPENILKYTFGELLDYIGRQFPHLSGGAKALAAAVLEMEMD